MLQASSLGHEVECWKVALIVVIPIAHLSCVLFGGCLNCNIKGSSLVLYQLEIWLKEFINPRAAVIAAVRCHTNSICDFQYASGFFWCCSSKAQAKSTAPDTLQPPSCHHRPSALPFAFCHRDILLSQGRRWLTKPDQLGP